MYSTFDIQILKLVASYIHSFGVIKIYYISKLVHAL